MSGRRHELDAGRPPAGPLPRTPVALDDALVVDALARLAGAASRATVADAVLPLLLELPGVRAAAVLVRDGSEAVVVGSAGYDCGTMAPGAALPLDAGLPVTEAVRTGRTVLQGSGPSWVAVPFGGRAGALLLSLTTAPPQAASEQARLQRVARGTGDALLRAGRQEHAAAELAVVTSRLLPPPSVQGAVLRSLPHEGPVGGDLALCVPDGRGGRWSVVADVCGCGLPAAAVARSVHAALMAVLPYVEGPAALLSATDRALRAALEPGLFVTAVVAHESAGRLRVASAGHPHPVLLSPSGARVLEVDPGLPLALDGSAAAGHPERTVDAAPGEVLMLHSDGLVDRRTPAGPATADPLALVAGRPLDDLEALADAVLAAAEQVGSPGDDVTLLLVPPN